MSAPASLPYAFLDAPGLVLEAMTPAHLAEAAQLMVEAGLMVAYRAVLPARAAFRPIEQGRG